MKKGGLGVTEIANQIDINKSSVYRILSTLVQYGYVEQDGESGRYKLGYKFLEISSKLLESIDLRNEARPFLQQLENQTNEVIHLVVLDQSEVVYIEKLEGNEVLRMHSKVGKGLQCMHFCRKSHFLTFRCRIQYYRKKSLPVHTDHTIINKEDLFKDLEVLEKEAMP